MNIITHFFPAFLFFTACGMEGPAPLSCPQLSYPTQTLTEIAPSQKVVLLFDRPIFAPAEGAYLVKARDAGFCTPACPGFCVGKRCQVSRVDDNFLSDAGSPSLSQSHTAMTIPITMEEEGNRIQVKPAYGSFEPDTLYQLILTPHISDSQGMPLLDPTGQARAFPINLVTLPDNRETPELTMIYPQNEAKNIPLNLSFLILGSSQHLGNTDNISMILYPVEGNAANEPIALLPERRGVCPDLFPDCLILWPLRTLDPKISYSLKVLEGSNSQADILPPWLDIPWFSTGEISWAFPLTLGAFSTEVITGCFHISWEASSPAVYDVILEDGTVAGRFFSPQGLVEMAVSHDNIFRIRGQGLDGSVVTGPSMAFPNKGSTSPRVVLTEIYANPLGKEPTQEYVEIMNISSSVIELEGYRITDDPALEGDLLPPFSLAPGGRAVIVGSTFTTTSEDPAPDSSDQIIYLGNSLVNSGMGNSGEPVYLFNSQGGLESRYGGWKIFTGMDGQSVERKTPTSCDVDQNWYFSTPTPGQ
ncbi:lamin tail domain-containing protein [Myxococcota bacterium]|nr:lamin tail domain-containing protein [Myxococcota bacterium]MBU1534243.1 lamin tail domain-containing protein [Myxococcota bacterium]